MSDSPPSDEVSRGLHGLFRALGFEAQLTDNGVVADFVGRKATYSLAVRAQDNQLELATSFPFRAPPERRSEVRRLAARLRLLLHPARFDISSDDGCIRLMSPLHLEGQARLLRSLFDQLQRMESYIDAFAAAALDGLNASAALQSPQPPTTPARTTRPTTGHSAEESRVAATSDSSAPPDKGEPLRHHPHLYEKWKAGWSVRRDQSAFLDSVRDGMDQTQRRYEELGLWERCVEFANGLRQLQAKAQQDIWQGQRPACAECKGFCCARVFGEGHLRDPYDLALFAVARPNLKQLVHTMDHTGCYFLGPEGCQLPVDVRPRACIMYACELMPAGSHATPGILALRRYYQQHRWLLPWRGLTSYEAVLSELRRVLPELRDAFPYRGRGRHEGKTLVLDVEAVHHPEVESVLLRVTYPLRIHAARRDAVSQFVTASNADQSNGVSYALDGEGLLSARDLVSYGTESLAEAGLENRFRDLLELANVSLPRIARA